MASIHSSDLQRAAAMEALFKVVAEHLAKSETAVQAIMAELIAQTDLAWSSAIVDGEGCVLLAKTRRNCGNGFNYRARVCIPQNCLRTLHTFQDRVGVHCKLVQLPHRESYTRPIYQLNFDGIHAYNLLKKLRPYLVRKAAEADVIFEYYRTCEPSRHFGPKGAPAHIWHARERCYQALRCLK